MQDLFSMQIVQAKNHLQTCVPRDVFPKACQLLLFSLLDQCLQIASVAVLHYDVKAVLGDEAVIVAHDKGAVHLRENCHLIDGLCLLFVC